MSIRSIMAAMAAHSQQCGALLEAGFTLADALKTRLDVVFLQTDPADSITSTQYETSPDRIRMAMEAMEERQGEMRKEVRNRFDQLASAKKIPVVAESQPHSVPFAQWAAVSGNIEARVSRRGRISDLILVSRPMQDDEQLIAEAALRGTGRPVLVVPPVGLGHVPERIAVAWNGGVEAARAVAGAMPLLEAAERVTVLTAESDRTPAYVATQAVEYLACHGIKAEVRLFPKGSGDPVGKALLDSCREIHAGMLVVGAYSHNRLHELLLGGVTRHVLSQAELPLFMAH